MQKKVMRTSCGILLALILSLLCVPSLWAKTVYLKNGEEIDCQSFVSKKGITYVTINRYTMVTFNNSEVDRKRTYHKKAVKPKRHLHKKKMPALKAPQAAANKPPAATTNQPLPKTQPVPTNAAPAKATAVKPVPARPVPAKPVPAKPVPIKQIPAKPLPAKPVPARPVPPGSAPS